MIIEINDMKTVGDIQDKFNEFFPFLKIEFYGEAHHWYEGSPQKNGFPYGTSIGKIRKQHEHGELEIHSWYKTGDLEQAFRKKFGLNVQVFRLQGNTWIQTINTDKLTLKEQNESGRIATVPAPKAPGTEMDQEDVY